MSTTVVVDTDVVSYLFKSHPTAFRYLPDLTDRTPMISFMNAKRCQFRITLA